MPLRARSDTYSIGEFPPIKGDSYLVDTNVWLAQVAPAATQNPKMSAAVQFKPYLDWIAEAGRVGAKLFACSLQYAEIAHRMEMLGLVAYTTRTSVKTTLKDFRHDCPSERAKYLQDLELAWQTVTSMATVISSAVDINVIQASFDAARKKEAVDAYDFFQIRAMESAGLKNVLTDDADFVTVHGLSVFTDNQKAIDAAQRSGYRKRRQPVKQQK